AKKAGIKPVIGLQLTIALNNVDGTNLELLFLAKDRAGYQNLMELSTRQQTSDRDTLPLTFEQIKPFLSSLYVIIPRQSTVFSWLKAEYTVVNLLHESTDQDSLLLGINPQLDQIQRSTLTQLAASHSLPLVGVSPV